MNVAKLLEFRKNQNLSLSEMADTLGVSKSYYEKIEYGDRTPSYNFILKLKKRFPEIDIDNFFCEEITRNV